MKRLWAFTTRTRRRKVTSVIAVLALVFVSAGLAAWFVYSGASGTGNGTFGSEQLQVDAITVTPIGAIPQIQGPNDVQSQVATFLNTDPNAAHSLDTLAEAFTSTPAECGSHLSFLLEDPLPYNFGPGASQQHTITVTSDAQLPFSCANGTYTLNLTGSTTP